MGINGEKVLPAALRKIPMMIFCGILAACNENSSSGTQEEEIPSAVSSSAGAFSSSSSGFPVLSSSTFPITTESSDDEEDSSGSISETSSSSLGTAWDYLNPAVSYGEFTDARDGQVYKTVVIGTQTWMAQNLNYGSSDSTECYHDSTVYCEAYGRLYMWNQATGLETSHSGDSLYRGICPEGWHVPTIYEWNTLKWYVQLDADKLKSLNGWTDDKNGTDDYGFAALPAGYTWESPSKTGRAGSTALFWSSTLYWDNDDIEYNVEPVRIDRSGITSGYYNILATKASLRCLMNTEQRAESAKE
jgi:uncharacterized protein (TIGR02145 family)